MPWILLNLNLIMNVWIYTHYISPGFLRYCFWSFNRKGNFEFRLDMIYKYACKSVYSLMIECWLKRKLHNREDVSEMISQKWWQKTLLPKIAYERKFKLFVRVIFKCIFKCKIKKFQTFYPLTPLCNSVLRA